MEFTTLYAQHVNRYLCIAVRVERDFTSRAWKVFCLCERILHCRALSRLRALECVEQHSRCVVCGGGECVRLYTVLRAIVCDKLLCDRIVTAGPEMICEVDAFERSTAIVEKILRVPAVTPDQRRFDSSLLYFTCDEWRGCIKPGREDDIGRGSFNRIHLRGEIGG